MRKKQYLFSFIAFLVSIAPLAVYLSLNYEYYFTRTSKSIGIGVFLVIIIMVYALKDKFAEVFKHNAQMKISLFLLIVFWGVSKVYNEVMLLSFLSFVGCVASIPFAIIAKKCRVETARQKQVEVTKEALSGVIEISRK